jgi:pyruvate,water dikinase
MNFSTKTGYHFSAVDSFCEPSPAKNYIHFRFVGGAADEQRRARRIRFLSTVLRDLDFTVRTHRDLLVARLSGIDQERTHTRLADLGRLTLCARQMDMLMDSDGSPDLFAGAFLRGEWDHF